MKNLEEIRKMFPETFLECLDIFVENIFNIDREENIGIAISDVFYDYCKNLGDCECTEIFKTFLNRDFFDAWFDVFFGDDDDPNIHKQTISLTNFLSSYIMDYINHDNDYCEEFITYIVYKFEEKYNHKILYSKNILCLDDIDFENLFSEGEIKDLIYVIYLIYEFKW